MRYNARKKVSVYLLKDGIGEYGESIVVEELLSETIELVCPMTSSKVKKEYGIETNNPKKVILSKPLPKTHKGATIKVRIDNEDYYLIDRTDFDKFNILLVDIK